MSSKTRNAQKQDTKRQSGQKKKQQEKKSIDESLKVEQMYADDGKTKASRQSGSNDQNQGKETNSGNTESETKYRQVLEVLLDRLIYIKEEDTNHFNVFIDGGLTVEQLYAEERKVKARRESGSSDQHQATKTNTGIKERETNPSIAKENEDKDANNQIQKQNEKLIRDISDQRNKIQSLEEKLEKMKDEATESEKQSNQVIADQANQIQSLKKELEETKAKTTESERDSQKSITITSFKALDVENEHKELNTQNRQTIKKLRDQIEELEKKLEQSQKGNNEKDLTRQRPSSRNSKSGNDKDKEHMRARLEEKDKEIQELKDDLQNKEASETRLQEEVKRMGVKVKKLEEDVQYKEASETKSQEELKRLGEKVQKLKDELQNKESSETRSQEELKRKHAENPNAEIKRLTDEVNGLRTRLSQMAGSKLTDNNPAIADLSDQNRPISLGEKFSELYDNEWTDAMEEINEKEGEKKAIQKLLTIVKEAYTHCQKTSEDLLKKIMGNMNPLVKVEEIPQEVRKICKDHRKTLAVHVVNSLQEEFLKNQEKYTDRKDFPNMVKYINKCVQLTWFMTVQDPMVAFDSNVPKNLDLDVYKPYTKQGPHIEYLVWPPLYLHKTDGKFGPMLGKGVAQGQK